MIVESVINYVLLCPFAKKCLHVEYNVLATGVVRHGVFEERLRRSTLGMKIFEALQIQALI